MLCSSSWSVFRPARSVGGRLALDGFRLLGPAVPVAHFGRAECRQTHAANFRPLIFDGPDKRGLRSGDKSSNGKGSGQVASADSFSALATASSIVPTM